jgi:hypothetical protein
MAISARLLAGHQPRSRKSMTAPCRRRSYRLLPEPASAASCRRRSINAVCTPRLSGDQNDVRSRRTAHIDRMHDLGKWQYAICFTTTTFSLRFWKSCCSVLCGEVQGMRSLLIVSVGRRCPEFSTCSTVVTERESNGRSTITCNPFGGTRVPGSDESCWAVSRFGESTPEIADSFVSRDEILLGFRLGWAVC